MTAKWSGRRVYGGKLADREVQAAAHFKWDRRFLEMALHVGTFSKDPRRQVGAVVVSPDRRSISIGYNGLPRGVADDPARLGDDAFKQQAMVHAELNALLNSSVAPRGWTLYSTLHPCAHCAAAAIQAGVARLVCPPPTTDPDSKWRLSQGVASSLLEEAGIEVEHMGVGPTGR